MASSATAGTHIPKAASVMPMVGARTQRHRRISPAAGRALEILGHAIEYLTDEYIHAGGSFSARNAQVEAVQLLMAINRQVYFECPETPSWSERCLALLRVRAA